MENKYNVVDTVASVLTIIGALNWGLVAAFEFDLVAAIFGEMTTLSRVVYGLVGLAGVYMVYVTIKMVSSRKA